MKRLFVFGTLLILAAVGIFATNAVTTSAYPWYGHQGYFWYSSPYGCYGWYYGGCYGCYNYWQPHYRVYPYGWYYGHPYGSYRYGGYYGGYYGRPGYGWNYRYWW